MVIASVGNANLEAFYPSTAMNSMFFTEDSLVSQMSSGLLQHVAATAAAITLPAPMMTAPVYRDASKAPLRKLSVDLIKTYKHINEVNLF